MTIEAFDDSVQIKRLGASTTHFTEVCRELLGVLSAKRIGFYVMRSWPVCALLVNFLEREGFQITGETDAYIYYEKK